MPTQKNKKGNVPDLVCDSENDFGIDELIDETIEEVLVSSVSSSKGNRFSLTRSNFDFHHSRLSQATVIASSSTKNELGCNKLITFCFFFCFSQ